MNLNKVKNFVNRNLVAIVMIPTLIGLHWGWSQIQQNETFVKPSEKKDLPAFVMYDRLKEKVKSYFPTQ